MHLLSQAAFALAVGRPAELPRADRPEVAFAGRSNVGKSSAINALCGRRALARTSKTPGRTQTINFYLLGDAARLADLPGYGYARVSKALRDRWAKLVEAYLAERTALVKMVLVMDARHPLSDLDLRLLAWLDGFDLLVLLSKADKLSRTEQARTLSAVQTAVAGRAAPSEVALFSSVSRQGVEDCRDLLERWLAAKAGPAPAGRENKKPPVKGM